MSAPTRFPSGVTNVASTDPMGQLGLPDPTKFHVWFDDFDELPTSTHWTITDTSVGAGTSAISQHSADGGVARISATANDNDGLFAQWNAGHFTVEEGKKLWLKTRFAPAKATQSDIIVGLHTGDTTPLDATDRFAFISEDGSASIFFNVDDNTTDVDSASVATLANDTYVELAAYYDGKGTIELFANGAKVTTMTNVSVPSGVMRVGFGYLNGEAGATTSDFDYILVVKER